MNTKESFKLNYVEEEHEYYKMGVDAVKDNDTVLYQEVFKKYLISRLPLKGIGISLAMKEINNYSFTEDDVKSLLKTHYPSVDR